MIKVKISVVMTTSTSLVGSAAVVGANLTQIWTQSEEQSVWTLNSLGFAIYVKIYM